MREISLETIVERVTEAVIRELKNQGLRVVSPGSSGPAAGNPETNGGERTADPRTRIERVDMSSYKTPVLTERHIRGLHPLTGIVAVPRGTKVSPKAKELMNGRNLVLLEESLQ